MTPFAYSVTVLGSIALFVLVIVFLDWLARRRDRISKSHGFYPPQRKAHWD